MKTMKLAACAAMALAAVASGQTTPTSAEYEMRFVPDAASGLTPAGGATSSSVIRFVVQARMRTADGTTNYGVNRWSSGSITGYPGSTVVRASANSATAFGRFRPLANMGAQNFARFAAASLGASSATGADLNNVNGAVLGNSITSIDAYRGFAWGPIVAPEDPETGEPIFGPGDAAANPWGGTNAGAIGGPVTDGSWGAWQSLYAFAYTVAPFNPITGADLVQTISLGGVMNGAGSIQFNGASWNFGQFADGTQASTIPGSTYVFVVWIPTPGAAALLGLGGLTMARRRR